MLDVPAFINILAGQSSLLCEEISCVKEMPSSVYHLVHRSVRLAVFWNPPDPGRQARAAKRKDAKGKVVTAVCP